MEYPHYFDVLPWELDYITMIAEVCDRESRRDLWFENRLVCYIIGIANS